MNTHLFAGVNLLCRDSGLAIKQFRYYDAATCGLDFKGNTFGFSLLHAQ